MTETSLPFVGRDEELGILGEHVRATTTGSGGVVLISGASGVGKTRLIEAVLHQQAGRVRPVDGAPLLADALNAPSPAAGLMSLRARLSKEFTVGSGPAIALVFDGLDESAPETSKLFAGWDGVALNARCIIVFCIRTRAQEHAAGRSAFVASLRRGSFHLDLGPLSLQETRLLVRLAAPRDAPPSLGRIVQIERLCEGSPALVLALLRGSRASDLVRGDGESFERLDPAALRFLDTAAVAGDVFDIARVARVAGLSIEEALMVTQSLVEAHVFGAVGHRSDRLAFRRPLRRAAILETLPAARARRLHLRFIEDLDKYTERGQHRRERAYHASLANSAEAARATSEAADEAMRDGAFVDAAAWYDTAFRLVGENERYEILRKRAFALRDLSSGPAALSAFEECLSNAVSHNPADVAQMLYETMWQYWAQARPDRVRSLAAQFEDIALPPDDPLAIRFRIALARFASEEHDTKRAFSLLKQVPVREVRNAPQLNAKYLIARARARAVSGASDSAYTELRRASRVVERIDDASIKALLLNDVAVGALGIGRLDLALSESQRAQDVAKRSHSEDAVASCALTGAEIELLNGNLLMARERVLEALGCLYDSMLVRIALCVGIRIGILLEDRTLVQACADEKAVEAAFRSARPDAIASVTGSHAQLLAARCDPRSAAALLHRAVLAIPQLSGSLWFAGTVAQIGSRRDWSRARALLAGRDNGSTELAQAMLLLFDAIIARREKHWREASRTGLAAAAAFAKIGAPHYEAQSYEAAGQNDAAVAIYERIGDLHDAQLVSSRRVVRRRGETSLTSRERDVAALAAQGLRTRAIAQILSISEKTVQHHLQKTYTKLGIHSRWRLPAEDLSQPAPPRRE